MTNDNAKTNTPNPKQEVYTNGITAIFHTKSYEVIFDMTSLRCKRIIISIIKQYVYRLKNHVSQVP